jgi:UDP-N-acetylmuramoyl-tripeptide--D-alanyl-D-alanine ligase
MMPLWNAAEVREATGGEAQGGNAWEAGGVSIDSRSVKEGDFFIAIIGENSDGHRYVNQALEAGAAAALVSYVPEDAAKDAPLIIVPDTFEALYDLAGYARNRMNGRVIAVTGSVGKTSVKEMLKAVLEVQGKTYATEGNLNNHYGLPLSLCRMPADCEYGIFEMGMSAVGEISPLSVLAKPDVAMISTVEAVHIEFFESVEKIADAKAEIFDGIKTGGTAILNRDNPHYFRLLEQAKSVGVTNILSFGLHEEADFRLVSYQEQLDGGEVAALCTGLDINYHLGVPGLHQVRNSLGVLAAVRAAGGNVTKAAEALSGLSAPKGRGKTHKITLADGKHITIIDDSYNASPASVKAALQHLGYCKKEGKYRRAVAILGEMYELGGQAEQMHKELAETVNECGIDGIITVGTLMKYLHDALPEEKRQGHFDSSEVLSEEIGSLLESGDVVLVKGSRGVKTDLVVEKLLGV